MQYTETMLTRDAAQVLNKLLEQHELAVKNPSLHARAITAIQQNDAVIMMNISNEIRNM